MVANQLKIYDEDPLLDEPAFAAEAKQAVEQSQLVAKSLPTPAAQTNILYQSRVMHEAVLQAVRFAHSSATVLLTGESGTGKEMFARLVHEASQRREKVFARVNCAALSENLIESELFGHQKGAFTGATESRVGRFEWADGGTLLLDEISEIPISVQAKLLRVLEENEFQRVGCNNTRRTNVRIIATSNRDLEAEVNANRFRNDLYHRLNVLQISIPPLRSRPEDIPLLTNRFVDSFQEDAQARLKGADRTALRMLKSYDWPGNVRQLRNVIHRACVLARGELITVEDLPDLQNTEGTLPTWILEMRLEEIERRVILECLQRFNWNKTQTAICLGVTARTLTNKIKTYREQGLTLAAS